MPLLADFIFEGKKNGMKIFYSQRALNLNFKVLIVKPS